MTLTVLSERLTDEIATASLCGTVLSSEAADVCVFVNDVHVSSPSVRSTVTYGRHCVAQQFVEHVADGSQFAGKNTLLFGSRLIGSKPATSVPASGGQICVPSVACWPCQYRL